MKDPKKLPKKQLLEIQNTCLYCNKKISVLCGTPIIALGGCCYGWTDKKNKVRRVFSRRAHIHCWLQHEHLKIVKDKKEEEMNEND